MTVAPGNDRPSGVVTVPVITPVCRPWPTTGALASIRPKRRTRIVHRVLYMVAALLHLVARYPSHGSLARRVGTCSRCAPMDVGSVHVVPRTRRAANTREEVTGSEWRGRAGALFRDERRARPTSRRSAPADPISGMSCDRRVGRAPRPPDQAPEPRSAPFQVSPSEPIPGLKPRSARRQAGPCC